MTARFDRKVLCPFCGVRIALADCPIVATNLLAADDLRHTFHQATPQVAMTSPTNVGDNMTDLDIDNMISDDDEIDPPRPSASHAPAPRPVSRPAIARFQPGAELESRIDRVSRVVVSPPPVAPPTPPGRRMFRSTPVYPLPSPVNLSSDLGGSRLRPARACPRPSCHHPLPAEIDVRDPFVVAVVGNLQASKTTLLAALVDLAERSEGREALQLDEFSTTQRTAKALRPVLKQFRQGLRAVATQAEAISKPLEFPITLTRFPEQPIVLLLHDIPGEVYMDEDHRAVAAAHIMWADAIVFVTNPEETPGIDLLESDADQSTVLNGIYEDLVSRGTSPDMGGHNAYPPLIMAVSKADILCDQGLLDIHDLNEESVLKALQTVQADDLLSAAARWPQTTWVAVAPMPSNGEPFGVAELFGTMLAAMTEPGR